MAQTLQEQMKEIEDQLSTLQQQEPLDINEINRLTNKKSELVDRLSPEEKKQMLNNEHEQRITQAVAGIDDVVDKMDFGGLSLKQVLGSEDAYQLVKLEFKKFIQSQADCSSKQIVDLQTVHSQQTKAAQEREVQLQRQNDNLQLTNQKLSADMEETNRLFNQERLERAAAEQTRNNALAQLEENRKEIERLNSHIDDLRNEIALGARGAIQVVDTEEEQRQKQALADKIRKERTIYNMDWIDPIKQNRYKAMLAVSGEEIEFPWTEKTKYFLIQESEVSQFREQYGVQPAVEVPDMAQKPVQAGENVAQEPQFPSPVVAPPTVPAVYIPSESTVGEVVPEPATKEWVKEQIEALKQEILGEQVA